MIQRPKRGPGVYQENSDSVPHAQNSDRMFIRLNPDPVRSGIWRLSCNTQNWKGWAWLIPDNQRNRDKLHRFWSTVEQRVVYLSLSQSLIIQRQISCMPCWGWRCEDWGKCCVMLLRLTSSMDLAQVGKTPDVSEPHSKADTSQQVLDLVVPFGSLLHSCFAHPHLGKKKKKGLTQIQLC